MTGPAGPVQMAGRHAGVAVRDAKTSGLEPNANDIGNN